MVYNLEIWVKHCRKFIFPLKLKAYGATTDEIFKKWTENGFKNTKSNFFQYMKALKHINLAKWFITLRYG